MRHYQLFFYTIFSIFTLNFIAGCSSDNSENLIRTQIIIQAALPKGGISASGQPIDSFATKGELSAYIRYNNGSFHTMGMASDRATFEIDNFQLGSYSFDIEFKYLTEEYGSITLVEATKSITITKEGGKILLFDEDSYQYLDDDNDQASNYNELKLGTNPIDEDKIKPETIAFPAGEGVQYWGSQTVILSCTDLGASGCDKTYYTRDGSDPTNIDNEGRIEYDSNILIEYDVNSPITNQKTTLKFYSIDRAGNEETPIKIAQYIIQNESIPPVTTLTKDPEIIYETSITVNIKCTDTGGSGCADMYYTTDGSEPKNIENEARIKYKNESISIVDDTILKYYSIDNAGNEEKTKIAEYKINRVIGAALSRSIQAPIKPYIAAETYSANLGNTIASFSSVHPSGDFAYRIENSNILGFRLKPATTTPIFKLTTQGIASSIAVHPSGAFAYISSYEQNNSWVVPYNIDPQTGVWTRIPSPTHIPSFNVKITAITPSGHFLYLLSDDRIISYSIAAKTRQLTETANQHTVLITPPSAALISQSGQQFYIRYQEADIVESYSANIQTGALDGPTEQIPANSSLIPKTMLILDQNLYLIDANSAAFYVTTHQN